VFLETLANMSPVKKPLQKKDSIPSLKDEMFKTTSEQIIKKLKKLRDKATFKEDKESQNDILWYLVFKFRIIDAIGQNDMFEVQLPVFNKSECKSGLQYLVSYSKNEKKTEIENDLISIQRNMRKAKTVISFRKIGVETARYLLN
jgi:hypothetical protein